MSYRIRYHEFTIECDASIEAVGLIEALRQRGGDSVALFSQQHPPKAAIVVAPEHRVIAEKIAGLEPGELAPMRDREIPTESLDDYNAVLAGKIESPTPTPTPTPTPRTGRPPCPKCGGPQKPYCHKCKGSPIEISKKRKALTREEMAGDPLGAK